MGHILDFVPNHVGIMGADNAWWMDVLENGKASRFADFFDIDWSPPNPALADKLLVPALGDPLRHGPRARRAAAEIRAGAGLVRGVLLQPPLSHRSAHLPGGDRAGAGAFREPDRRPSRAREPERRVPQSAGSRIHRPDRGHRARPRRGDPQAAADGAVGREPRSARGHRSRRHGDQRLARQPFEFRRPSRSTGAPVLSPRLLASGGG